MILDYLKLYPEAFGLDISDRSLKIAQLHKIRGGYKLVSYGETSIPAGVIDHGKIVKEKELISRVKKALKDVKGEKIETPYVTASLPEEQAFLQVVQLPKMNEDEVEHAIRFEAENYIPYPIETVYLDFQIIEPLNNHLDHLDVLIGALPRIAVDAYVDVLEKAGLMPQSLDIESVAVSRVLMANHTSKSPVLIIDLGASRSNFIVFSGHTIRFTAANSFASGVITSEIARVFKVQEKKAEALKKAFGIAVLDDPEGKKVANAVTPLLNDFVAEIKKYMSFYESHPAHQHLAKENQNINKII